MFLALVGLLVQLESINAARCLIDRPGRKYCFHCNGVDLVLWLFSLASFCYLAIKTWNRCPSK